MSLWDDAAAMMHSAVDETLGDTILYGLPGALQPVQGFVLVASDNAGHSAIDENLTTVLRVKIAKSLVGLPVPGHRLQHPLLGPGTFRPMAKQPETEGHYWLIDVQAV